MSTVIHLRSGAISDGDRDILGPWAEANGINPMWVPMDNDIYVLKTGIALDMYVHDNGEIAYNADGPVRRPVFIPCTPTPIPALLFTHVEEMP